MKQKLGSHFSWLLHSYLQFLSFLLLISFSEKHAIDTKMKFQKAQQGMQLKSKFSLPHLFPHSHHFQYCSVWGTLRDCVLGRAIETLAPD
jgi:hypothetical protein